MKNFSLLVVMFVAMFALFFTSCSSKPQTPEKRVTTTVSTTTAKADPGSYFLVQKNISVKPGETIWGYAKVEYRNGLRWRDIVAQNQFLSEQGRVYKNAKGEWIVKIYPGEVIMMGNEVVNPTNYTISEKTTTTEVITPASAPATPTWIWLIVGAVIALVVILAIALFRNRDNCYGRNNAIVHVNIGRGQGIDAATHIATAEANNAFQMHVATQAFSNPTLTHAHISQSSDPNQRFEIHTDYDPQALQPRQ